MKHLACVLLLLMAAPSFSSGGDVLLTGCRAALAVIDNNPSQVSESDMFPAGYCMGAVNGVGDTAKLSKAICISDSVSRHDLMRIVLKFLEDNPTQLQTRDTLLILMALMQKFPCEYPD